MWLASKTLPDNSRWSNDLLPDGLQSCWWWFEGPLPIPMNAADYSHDDLDVKHVHGLLLIRNPSGLCVVDCRMSSFGPMCTGMIAVSEGATLGELGRADVLNIVSEKLEPSTARNRLLVRFVMAAGVWLKQRIVVISSGHVERHRRKQLIRENDAPIIGDVKVVQLRRAESNPVSSIESGDPVEWSCRWIVSGHWRNQYHASTGRHELQYILPYVKGPADKPLKVPAQTVYSVSR